MARQRRRAIQSANIRDVAARAGVSPMTVSRVINRENNVRPRTRELVNAAIRELNYTPSPAARSLAGSEPFRVGLLYDNPSLGYLGEILLGALDESSRTGAQVLVEKCAGAHGAGATIEKLLRAGVEGLIVPAPLCESAPVLAEIARAELAAVALAPGEPTGNLSTVRIDNEAAARELTRHLLALGHVRFGFIQGPPDHGASALRLKGFLGALAEAGIAGDAIQLEPGYFTYRSGLQAARQILGASSRPTAIFAANDDMAAAACSLAHSLGLDVPQDISIVGFDDTPMASTIWPALTTMHQPVAAMARAAVDLALQEIRRRRDGAGQPRHLVHPHMLVIRESTARAPEDR
ncbi:MAG: LacI family DNA-binding transcriptional regulator [Steroidobacteraceae bacterium]